MAVSVSAASACVNSAASALVVASWSVVVAVAAEIVVAVLLAVLFAVVVVFSGLAAHSAVVVVLSVAVFGLGAGVVLVFVTTVVFVTVLLIAVALFGCYSVSAAFSGAAAGSSGVTQVGASLFHQCVHYHGHYREASYSAEGGYFSMLSPSWHDAVLVEEQYAINMSCRPVNLRHFITVSVMSTVTPKRVGTTVVVVVVIRAMRTFTRALGKTIVVVTRWLSTVQQVFVGLCQLF